LFLNLAVINPLPSCCTVAVTITIKLDVSVLLYSILPSATTFIVLCEKGKTIGDVNPPPPTVLASAKTIGLVVLLF